MKRLLHIVLGILLLTGCDGYFGNKTDLDFIDKPEFSIRDISYVPIQPALTSFVRPTDITTGYDELLYVVDAGSEEIISLDESGRELGRFTVPGVHSVIQDRQFDLLAIGTKTDTISGIAFDLTCIYRIDLHGSTGYGIRHAHITNEIVHPFYYKSTFSGTDADVVFNHIGLLQNNGYYVSRNGPGSNPFSGPDDAILLFNAQDKFITPVAVSSNGALYRDYFKKPFGITTQVQPPQLFARGNNDFFYTSISPDGVIKSQYIQYVETEFGATYEPRIMTQDTSEADGFLTYPYRFDEPAGLTMAGDGTNHVFISDRVKDSVYLFSLNGYEGVKPPPGYSSSKYIVVSFGGKGQGLSNFNEPMGLAYKNKILYVADAGNGRVLRFKLTSDFD
ncbi:MAG: hypothetical protein H6608_09635 [Flavobacteriales bacterium]|nr:hypothetical protein [Bacteroidota bacterium]MCB9241382.1 hypothetical protein [Flavobacteriales bacterium]